MTSLQVVINWTHEGDEILIFILVKGILFYTG